MPPSRPAGGRRRSSTLPPASASQKCTPCRSGRAGFAALRGSSPAMPARRPAQCAIQGHSTQPGAAGVQTVAPRSNSAWAKSAGRAIASGSAPSCPARRRSIGLAAGNGSSTANSRATTRSTLPSTGTPAGRTRSPRPRPRCSRRCPAAPAGRPDRAGSRPPRPRLARRHAGCGRGRSSLAPPRRPARPPAARRPAPRRWESALRRLHSRVSSLLRWSAAA